MLVKIQTPASRRKAALPAPEPWPPMEYRLPDTIARIEVGRPEQQQLMDEPVDDSRAGRLARILAGVPGVVRADRLPPPPRGAKSLVSIGSEPPCNPGGCQSAPGLTKNP